ncbi:sulfite exporter TauE/SafE family protein [Streptomyces sp. NBC_01723]|uniref:sulfite exporter TauE/SafE family protein n=1 Tax=unclassified Streptomyces TaxID=2593676 RepID=UPI00278AB38D|nr:MULTISPECIES: sulfite exporter TauE/SafE family protein [unclassified Streptomyces]MDQ0401774.1 putative membrane protein YfcA [Streptomyces sp. DSM 40167]
MGLTGPEVVLLSVTVGLGALLQVSVGFGLGMIAAPVFALVDPALAPTAVLLLATGVTAAVLVRERGRADLRGCGWALAGRLPGVLAGALLVVALPARHLALLVAAVVLAGATVSVAGYVPRQRRSSVVLAGMASGLMGTATSIGGPPMAMVWQRLGGPELRATMSAFFLAGSLMSLAALTAAGTVGAHALRGAALLTPAAVAGVLLAGPLTRRLNVRRTRAAATALAVAGAVVLVLQQFV